MPNNKPPPIASAWPFVRQIDIFLPNSCSSGDLSKELQDISITYARARVSLTELVQAVRALPATEHSDFCALAVTESDDYWCIDCQGRVHLNVCKETYQRLGLTVQGKAEQNKRDRYDISVPMFEQVGLKEAERIKTAIHTFDNIYREQTGGQWDVLLSSPLLVSSSMYSARPQQRTRSHSAPIVHLSAKPKDPYASLEWEENIHALFEWTGMACLGSQRLEVNDRVDQYVSTYEPPTPSAISHGAHLMWRGFMSPSHVQHILDTLVMHLAKDGGKLDDFVSVTAHAFSASPVTRLALSPIGSSSSNLTIKKGPQRDMNKRSEDGWSLIMQVEKSLGSLVWVLAEDVDNRVRFTTSQHSR